MTVVPPRNQDAALSEVQGHAEHVLTRLSLLSKPLLLRPGLSLWMVLRRGPVARNTLTAWYTLSGDSP